MSEPVLIFLECIAVGFVRPVNRLNECDVIDTPAHTRVETDRSPTSAGFAVLSKLPGTAQQVARLGKLDPRLFNGQWLAVESAQFRFVVEGIDVRGPAMHEQKNDAFRAGWKMARMAEQRILSSDA